MRKLDSNDVVTFTLARTVLVNNNSSDFVDDTIESMENTYEKYRNAKNNPNEINNNNDDDDDDIELEHGDISKNNHLLVDDKLNKTEKHMKKHNKPQHKHKYNKIKTSRKNGKQYNKKIKVIK